MKNTPTIGCIGTGAMGGALLCGLARPQNYTLLGYNRSPDPLKALEAVGVIAQESARELTRNADIIILAVKPYAIQSVIEEILPELTPEKILVSVASVVKLEDLRVWAKGACPCVRVMATITSMVGAGTVGVCLEDPLLPADSREMLFTMLRELGQTYEVSESRINQFMAVFACGPGYLFHIMESVAEAAVTVGFSRADAIELTASMFYGVGKMAAESGQHPANLREQVCTPGGITITGVNHLDRTAIRGHLIDTILNAERRAIELENGRKK